MQGRYTVCYSIKELEEGIKISTLFQDFMEAMCEDYIRHDQLNDQEIALQERHINLCLWDIISCFRVHGKSITDTEYSDLPQLPDYFIHPHYQIE